MSDTVITVEGLGKKYRIRHQAEGRRYVALRDVIAQKIKAPFHFLRRSQKSEVRSQNPASGHSSLVTRHSSEDFWALKDISFEVKQGEVLGIIGRNGAGKSTLLKILSRITEPTEGRVRIRGRVASLLEVGTGFHPELTGRENIFLNGAILGMHRTEIKRKFDEIVAFAEVEKFLDTPVKRYSSGMYVRLAFAVAAHLEPEILVVDEVLAVGDAQFQKKCLGKMQDVSRSGRTVLFVSHNMGIITDLCQQCLCLRNGKVHKIGSTKEVVREYLATGSVAGEVDLHTWTAERSGDGPMRVLKLSLLDREGQIRSTFEHGEPIEFRVRIWSDRARESILCIAIRDAEGRVILHLTNTDDEAAILVTQGESEAKIGLPGIILNDGDFYVTVWLGDGMNTLHDRVGNCLGFRVSSQQLGSIRSQGAVRVAATWAIAPAEALPETSS
jgi:lipopolysaccharide transport system ATP-binding protein